MANFKLYRSKSKREKQWQKIRFALLLVFLVTAITLYIKDNAPTRHPTGEYGVIEDAAVGEEQSSSSESLAPNISNPDTEDFLSSIPDYSEVNRPAYAINGNKPNFTEEDYERAKNVFIELSELDTLGRCGTCIASLGKDTLAEGERDFDLSHVTPSGWRQAQYPDLVDNGGWLYNRCHLIMYAVSGLTDDPRNLITGTRYMNDKGMLAYSEKAVQNYIIRRLGPEGRILYRVTPIFKGEELLCRGVHIEAADTETRGEAFHINVFCYNVQPGVEIDYLTGANWEL